MVKNLKKLRLEKGISQQQLADVVLVSQQSINKYENHHIEPDIETLIKIADYFGVSVDYLIGRTENLTCEMSETEHHLLCKYRSLTPIQKDAISKLLKSYN